MGRATNQAIARAIRESIDSYPGGLCFSTREGRPILVNARMNELAFRLTGHTVVDACASWEEWEAGPLRPGCARLEEPWLPREAGGAPEDRQLFLRLEDGTVWRLRRRLGNTRPPTLEIEADEMTELCRASERLFRDNARLAALQQRQRALLADIVAINQEKELLAAKMRIHDELGQCLLATKKALARQTLDREGPALRQSWENTLRDLTNIPLDHRREADDPREELLRAARMIGCQVRFFGPQPAGRRAQRLLYAAVREALTNAVRHAGADELTVTVQRVPAGYRAVIASNGAPARGPIREGDGLGGLRRKLEQEGAALEVRQEGGVALLVEIPAQDTEEGAR